MSKHGRILVAMSGGVDAAVTALLDDAECVGLGQALIQALLGAKSGRARQELTQPDANGVAVSNANSASATAPAAFSAPAAVDGSVQTSTPRADADKLGD